MPPGIPPRERRGWAPEWAHPQSRRCKTGCDRSSSSSQIPPGARMTQRGARRWNIPARSRSMAPGRRPATVVYATDRAGMMRPHPEETRWISRDPHLAPISTLRRKTRRRPICPALGTQVRLAGRVPCIMGGKAEMRDQSLCKIMQKAVSFSRVQPIYAAPLST